MDNTKQPALKVDLTINVEFIKLARAYVMRREQLEQWGTLPALSGRQNSLSNSSMQN